MIFLDDDDNNDDNGDDVVVVVIIIIIVFTRLYNIMLPTRFSFQCKQN